MHAVQATERAGLSCCQRSPAMLWLQVRCWPTAATETLRHARPCRVWDAWARLLTTLGWQIMAPSSDSIGGLTKASPSLSRIFTATGTLFHRPARAARGRSCYQGRLWSAGAVQVPCNSCPRTRPRQTYSRYGKRRGKQVCLEADSAASSRTTLRMESGNADACLAPEHAASSHTSARTQRRDAPSYTVPKDPRPMTRDSCRPGTCPSTCPLPACRCSSCRCTPAALPPLRSRWVSSSAPELSCQLPTELAGAPLRLPERMPSLRLPAGLPVRLPVGMR